MAVKVSLQISDKAYEKLSTCSEQLGLSPNQFASICFEYVDISHKGILAAARKFQAISSPQKPARDKNDLEKHLQNLSDEQVELLLLKAAQKSKS